jgi:hypothetical protein
LRLSGVRGLLATPRGLFAGPGAEDEALRRPLGEVTAARRAKRIYRLPDPRVAPGEFGEVLLWAGKHGYTHAGLATDAGVLTRCTAENLCPDGGPRRGLEPRLFVRPGGAIGLDDSARMFLAKAKVATGVGTPET